MTAQKRAWLLTLAVMELWTAVAPVAPGTESLCVPGGRLFFAVLGLALLFGAWPRIPPPRF